MRSWSSIMLAGRIARIVILALAFGAAPSAFAANVSESASSFSPAAVTIAQGDSVTWTGLQLGAHNVVQVSQATWNANGTAPLAGGFTSGGPGAVSSFSFTFTGPSYPPGTYYYVCQTHASMGMKGTVTVVAPAETVAVSGTAFAPPTVTIDQGETVLWTGLVAGTHNVVEVSQATWNANGSGALGGGFNSGGAGTVNTFSHTFAGAPGTYYYVCQPHAIMGMKGTVVVLPPPAATVTTSGNTFAPTPATIYEGDTVRWNSLLAGSHNVVEVDQTTWNNDGTTPVLGGFTSGAPGAVDVFDFTFGPTYPPGTYYYVCQPHASMGMKGEIVVLPLPDQTVATSGNSFVPATIGITQGDTVRWTGLLGAHNVVEVSQATWLANGSTPLPGGFSSGVAGSVATFDFTFDAVDYAAGTYYYVCQPHATMGMKGKIIIQSANSAADWTVFE